MAAPLWLLFLLIGILISLQAQFIRPEYFPKTFTLYPQWPAQDPVRAAYVFAGTMALLLLPKLIGYLAMLPTARRAAALAAALRAFLSMLTEIVISGLIAPVMMLIQSASVMADPERPRQRLAGAAARRRHPAAARHDAPLRLAHGVRACCSRSPPTRCRTRCSPG